MNERSAIQWSVLEKSVKRDDRSIAESQAAGA
jgi:hypothetical protein